MPQKINLPFYLCRNTAFISLRLGFDLTYSMISHMSSKAFGSLMLTYMWP